MSRLKRVREVFQQCWNTLRGVLRRWWTRPMREHLEWEAENPERAARGHWLRERYGLDEKPPGWNKDVLHHFHAGPELRDKERDGFADAFREKISAEPRERTLMWAERFRSAAAAAKNNGPPLDVHPLIHQAMIDSFIAKAEELEAEAAAL